MRPTKRNSPFCKPRRAEFGVLEGGVIERFAFWHMFPASRLLSFAFLLPLRCLPHTGHCATERVTGYMAYKYVKENVYFVMKKR